MVQSSVSLLGKRTTHDQRFRATTPVTTRRCTPAEPSGSCVVIAFTVVGDAAPTPKPSRRAGSAHGGTVARYVAVREADGEPLVMTNTCWLRSHRFAQVKFPGSGDHMRELPVDEVSSQGSCPILDIVGTSDWAAEEWERGWHSSDMYVCVRCVGDDYLREIVASAVTDEQVCSFCDSASAAEFDVLMEAFMVGVNNRFEQADNAGVPWEGGYFRPP